MEGGGWADPFAGKNSPAEFTNDLNPNTPAKFHLDANDFMTGFDENSLGGVLFDPPYSLRQIAECYEGFGAKLTWKETTSFYSSVKNIIAKKIKPGGVCISFGWNSNGLGKNRGFEINKILLVAHGRDHNDTIVVVEKKMQTTFEAEKC